MSFISGMIVVSVITIAAFCFYCGVITLSSKIKAESLLEVLKEAVILFLVVAAVVLMATKVGNSLSPRANTAIYGTLNV
jgi:energy-coupling factor transporter transmembrane protein EcfT